MVIVLSHNISGLILALIESLRASTHPLKNLVVNTLTYAFVMTLSLPLLWKL